jgi:hypothetical protein
VGRGGCPGIVSTHLDMAYDSAWIEGSSGRTTLGGSCVTSAWKSL